jgi:hypothetical protein
MELQFDKEIDAILRKARAGVADDKVKKGHIDADAVAAFAENALPEKVRALYMEHFADCGRCRKLLSESMAWPPAETKAASAAAPLVATSGSWLSRLFRTPNLAMAMGGLVIVFAGVLGYIVLQNRSRSENATVAQISDDEAQHGGPYLSQSAPAEANANMAMANTAANTAKTVSNTTPTNSTVSSTATGTVERGPESTADTTTNEPPAAVAEQPVTAAPPPAAADKSAPKTEDRRGRDEEKSKDDDAKETANKQYDGMSREAKKVGGPYRSVGPRNQQNTNDSLSMNQTNQLPTGGASASAVSTVKNAGGKKFERRNGAWYDTAYHGQATKNIGRGSVEYSRLDGGLRSMAASIGGVVVVMWKGTAYRIQ